MEHKTKDRTENWFSRLKNNGFFQVAVGFLCYLIVAAMTMYLFESSEKESGFVTFFQSLWFTIVTATTVGYGDISPLSSIGKVAAVIIMFIGICYTGILTGGITSWLVERNQKKAQGFVPIKKKGGHFLIFGWRPDMGDLLKNILHLHQKTSKNLVLVNDVDVIKINEVRQDPILRDFYFFRGDHTNVDTLYSTCAHAAEKVLILSDENPVKSPDEIDFKTVLSAKAAERINPQIFTAAEIIQPHFETSLKKSNIEEVVLNRYLIRSLISNVALMTGLKNIVHSIFDINTGLLDIQEIDKEWLGKSYQSLKTQLSDKVIIGILENTGDLLDLKTDKMAQVQRSVSIKSAIQGLVELKKMQNHQPVIHPSPDYIIKENSAFIMLNIAPGELNNRYKYETQEIENTKEEEIKKILRLKVESAFEKISSYEQLDAFLKQNKIELYHYNEKISGVIFQNQKYAFEILNFIDDIGEKINLLYQKQGQVTEEVTPPLPLFDDNSAIDSILSNFKAKAKSNIFPSHPEKLKLMFCGWRDLLPEMIDFILSESEEHQISWEQITIVADTSVQQRDIFNEHFKENPKVKLVQGDFTNRQTLIHAGIKKMNRVIVLAELDSNRSFQEIDARSVLTAMALGELNKYAYKVVEILDHKYEKTLQYSEIEEIIPADYFSRTLLAIGFHGKGVSNIFHTMVNMNNSCFKLIKIDDRYTGSSFSSFLSKIHTPQQMVLGLIEETGNIFVRKSHAIHKAQFEPAIKNSVSELKKVKDISANKVVLAPLGTYEIKSNSRLILIESNDPKGWSNYLQLFT